MANSGITRALNVYGGVPVVGASAPAYDPNKLNREMSYGAQALQQHGGYEPGATYTPMGKAGTSWQSPSAVPAGGAFSMPTTRADTMPPISKPAAAPQVRAPAAQPTSPNYIRNETTGRMIYLPASATPSYATNDRTGAVIPFSSATQSPADVALQNYYSLMNKEGGGIGEAIAARGQMKQYQALKPFDIQATEEAGRTAREKTAEQAAMARTKETAAPSEESLARAGLLREQAKSAQYATESAARTSLANRIIMNPEKYTPNQVANAREFINRQHQQAMELAIARATGEYPAVSAPVGYADGGVVGSRTMPMIHPMVSQYGQYLHAASQAGVPPVAFGEYLNLLQSTKDQMHQTPALFADGGEVGTDTYARPSNVDWSGVVGAGLRSMFGMKQAEAQPTTPSPAPTPAPASAPAAAPVGDQAAREAYNRYAQSSRDAGVEPPSFEEYKSTFGYANGGAIDVSGKHVRGPGGPRTDSIPAVINGVKPAALSDGEFVIPAHVVKAKGTEFFDKLVAQYEDKKGQ